MTGPRSKVVVRRIFRHVLPISLVTVAARPRMPRWVRVGAIGGLFAFWSAVYRVYRQRGRAQTAREYEQLKTNTVEAFTRHYNERVPTITEEFEVWGEFHQHRHEMRYDLVADWVRRHVPRGGRILDIGCGSALVAERLTDVEATYTGLDFPSHQIGFSAKSFADRDIALTTEWIRGDGEKLPLADDSVDVVVMSEVIEHLVQPELAVYEIGRVLRPGGVFVMTTNNASEMPLYSPVSHLFPWLENLLGAKRPHLISLRPWVWPDPVDPSILPEGSPKVFVPHTHHIYAETRDLFAGAGLETFHWSSFEFPPPQAATAAWLDKRGDAGQRIVDIIEAVAQRTPGVRKLGCHIFMVSRRTDAVVPTTPPPGVWPGPFSEVVA